MKMPSVWMEPRCGSVLGALGDNWGIPEGCEQTGEGWFFRNVTDARAHFRKIGWKIIMDHYWCPHCANLLEEEA